MSYYSLDKAIFFKPDWVELHIKLNHFKAQYVQDSGVEFKFTGPGWYISGSDTLLVLNGDEEGIYYNFYCWNDGQDVIESFRQITNAPVQSRL